jgi:RNA polymerase sigma-70 factor (ECF subfamily)
LEAGFIGLMEEKEIVLRCLQGNVEDFKVIVDKYRSQAMALAMNILRNREDAEDACQEAFIQVFRNLNKFRLGMSFKNWLYTILYHRCLDQLKRKRRFSRLFEKIRIESPQILVRQASNPVEKRPLPQTILKHLTSKEKTVLCLWANEGYSAQEISEVLQCSASTARVYLFNARKKIKALLEKKDAALENY